MGVERLQEEENESLACPYVCKTAHVIVYRVLKRLCKLKSRANLHVRALKTQCGAC
jgi:hypothetical protein